MGDPMFYVKRDAMGKVIAVSAEKIHEHKIVEELSSNHPSIVEFLLDGRGIDDEDLSRYAADLYELRLSDLAFIRVLEDVIYLLLDKNILQITEFPPHAIRRIQSREKIREKLRQMGSGLLPSDKKDPPLNIDNLKK